MDSRFQNYGSRRVFHNQCFIYDIYVKPIFHCDAKSFALGTFTSPNAKDSTFAFPNARNTNMLVSLALGDGNFFAFYPTRNLKVAFYPTPTPDASQWNIGGVGPSGFGDGVGHVHFMLFMSISLRRAPNANFSVEYWL